uniref:Kinesin-like protein n=1 Tax=Caenorhabditis tropicalis TaxID=1561998 RepID=A0A1I7SY01_9PELO
MSQYIKTYARIRPSARENGSTSLLPNDKTVTIDTENGPKSYELHRIFDDKATQEEVFTCVSKKIVEDSAEGFNGTVFAYGQTGSGKTHTMLGPCNSWSDPDRKGLIPRSIEYLFQLLDRKAKECQKFTFFVNVEFVELYNEDIFDLLNMKNKVQLRDTGKDIQLVGAKSESVDNSLDLMHVVERGWQSRSVGSTAMNSESSRSHALLIVKIKTHEVTGGLVKERYSTLNLVDLAGSERQSHTKAVGDRFKEATNINSSLTVLGRCIRILSKPSGNDKYVPYRDSHLTHILKNSLGGNSKTAVVVNMHPDKEFIQETNSTLMFAQSCTMIKNAVTRNEVMTGDQENSYKKAIQELRKEVDETRSKAREEFAKKLIDAEDFRLRLTEENDKLKAENADIRAKYNLALVKYNTGVGSNEIVKEFEKTLSKTLSEAVQNTPNDDFENLVSKYHTLRLECEANEKRQHELQQELNSLRNRYQDNLNTTIQMQTPNAKERRSSTRPKRRETQYIPSPARRAELEVDNDQELQEAHLQIEKLACELQVMQSKYEESSEQTSRMEIGFEKTKNTLQKKVEELSDKLTSAEEENEELVEKKNEKAIAELEASKLEANEKYESDIDSLRNHYELKIKSLQQQYTDIQEMNLSLQDTQKDICEKETIISKLEQDVAEKTKEVLNLQKELSDLTTKNASLERDFKAQSESLASLQKEFNDQAHTIIGLRKEINFKSETAANFQRDFDSNTKMKNKFEEELKMKSKLISSLEQEIVKKAEEIIQLQEEKSELHLDIDTIKRQSTETAEADEKEKNYLRQRNEELQKKIQENFKGFEQDIKVIKAKKDQELMSLQKSLDAVNKQLKQSETLLKKEQSVSERKFNEQVSEMTKKFKEAHMNDMKQQQEKIRRESMSQMESAVLEKESKIHELEKMNEYYKKQHSEDSATIANMLGTKQQKTSYIEKVRQEKADTERKIAQLRAENDRLSKGQKENNRPVLRTRTPR